MSLIKQANLFGAITLMTVSLLSSVHAEALTAIVPKLEPATANVFHLGTARSPDGATITADRSSLRLNDQPWTPVMGEFHYTRYPANDWRDE